MENEYTDVDEDNEDSSEDVEDRKINWEDKFTDFIENNVYTWLANTMVCLLSHLPFQKGPYLEIGFSVWFTDSAGIVSLALIAFSALTLLYNIICVLPLARLRRSWASLGGQLPEQVEMFQRFI